MERKVALVTGVSRLKGMGRAICLELAKRNFDIFFTYWTEYDNEMPWKVNSMEPDMIQKEIIALGVQCEKLELDLALETSPDLLFQKANDKLGLISVLVNNATYSTMTNIHNLNASELDRHYAINVKATTLLSTTFVKQFNIDHGGRIINLTSGQSLGKMSTEIAYAITKGSVETLTDTLSSVLASRGITINAVNPGPNDTGWIITLKKNWKPSFL